MGNLHKYGVEGHTQTFNSASFMANATMEYRNHTTCRISSVKSITNS